MSRSTAGAAFVPLGWLKMFCRNERNSTIVAELHDLLVFDFQSFKLKAFVLAILIFKPQREGEGNI